MNIPVIWKSYNPESPAKGYWDQGLLEDLLNNKIWLPVNSYDFVHYDSFDSNMYDVNEGAIVIIPARSNAKYVDAINQDISNLKWVILMLTGDEENIFPVDKLKHDNMIVYVMSPRENLDKSKFRVLGTGYPPQLREHVNHTDAPKKYFDWFFSGQITHERRELMAAQLNNMHNDAKENKLFGHSSFTQGFTQGMPHKEYYSDMASAKTAPCPSGPETPDTFRLFEALELGCVPIADTLVSKGGFSNKYWSFFFDENPPFPVIENYDDLPGYIEDCVHQYPRLNNRVFAWWQRKKRDLAYTLLNDIKSLSGIDINNASTRSSDNISVVIPVSPIKSHPQTDILEETIASVRHHLPDCEIFVTFDGVRLENEDRRQDYEEHIRRMLWKFNFEYKNIVPIIFEGHMHQTGMARKTIDMIKTPLLLYVEQDAPLVRDIEIPFESLQSHIISGKSDCIRFHHEGVIPSEHSHMILGMEPMLNDPLMRTCQWSQRPHLASKAFYRRILENCFSENAKSFIEDKMHGVAHQAYVNDGLLGWEQYKIHIYHPEGNIKRSYHTDGRAGEQKYDDSQVF